MTDLSFVDRHVGERVRERRTALNMSQQKLADALNVSFQQVQKYEKGTNRISASRLWAISRVLRTPIGDFFQGVNAHMEEFAASNGFQDEGSPYLAETVPADRTQRLVAAIENIGRSEVIDRLVELVETIYRNPPP